MHTIRPSGKAWDVIFVGERGSDTVFGQVSLAHATELASYLNGGERPSDAALLSTTSSYLAKDAS